MPIVILAIIGFILYVLFSKQKTTANPSQINKQRPNSQGLRGNLTSNNSSANKPINVNTNKSVSQTDNSVIDITGQSYPLNTSGSPKKYVTGVPFWAHHYVYSYSEINGATTEQKQFYEIFKSRFLNGEALDLEGNTNYAFILLFDLLQEYEKHKNIPQLENQLKILGLSYPKTRSYGISFLIKKMEACGDQKGIQRLKPAPVQNYQPFYYEPDYWKLGSKYKSKLNLSEEEVIVLNKLWNNSNAFTSIEFCYIQAIKLYLATIKELNRIYEKEQTSLNNVFNEVADVVAKKHFKYRAGSQNYKYSIESTINGFYTDIFKHCENAVREHYGHKRKINTDSYITDPAKQDYELKVISKAVEIIATLTGNITIPDEATEIELNQQNTARWKTKFETLTTSYIGNTKQFVESIVSLGNENSKNPSIENIFFEASKFISKHDKEYALTLYTHYIYHDLKSATFDNRQLTKTIQKSLFKTEEQLKDFETVVNGLISDRNLEKALQGVAGIYLVKRKKIKLDSTAIKEVQQHDSGTVKLLNEYLKDDDDGELLVTTETENAEVKIVIDQHINQIQPSIYGGSVAFAPIHLETLEVFTKCNFTMPQNELEVFAKSKGVFKNQLVESINEACYEILDDLLIEEEDDYYTINSDYYKRLLTT